MTALSKCFSLLRYKRLLGKTENLLICNCSVTVYKKGYLSCAAWGDNGQSRLHETTKYLNKVHQYYGSHALSSQFVTTQCSGASHTGTPLA